MSVYQGLARCFDTLSLHATFLKVMTKIWVIWKLPQIDLMTGKSYLDQKFVFSFRKSWQIMYLITGSTYTPTNTSSVTKRSSTPIHKAIKTMLCGNASRKDPQDLPATPPLLLPPRSGHRRAVPDPKAISLPVPISGSPLHPSPSRSSAPSSLPLHQHEHIQISDI